MRRYGGSGDLDEYGWPPEPRDRFSGWAARRVARTAGWRIGLALIIFAVLWNAVILVLIFVDHSDEQPVVYVRYNDALVSGDLAVAWGLGCRPDRDGVPLMEFTARFERAVASLGTLESWSRLRGGPGWNGSKGSENRRPRIDEVDGHKCVRLGPNPLGEPF